MPKISALTLLAAASIASGDLFAIVDVSASTTMKTTMADVRTALLAGGTGFTAGDKINMGAAPGSGAAVNVDVASFSNVALGVYNGATLVGTVEQSSSDLYIKAQVASAKLYLWGNNLSKWYVGGDASGTSSLVSVSAVAQLVSGSTSLAVRNSGNTRNNFSVADSGASIMFTDGTRTGSITLGANNGEMLAGTRFTSSAGNVFICADVISGGAGTVVGAVYYNQTQWFSAWEVASVASGFGTLALLKSGGVVTFPASTTAQAGARFPHGTAPTSPVNGDYWTTTAGAFTRINGVTKTFTLT